MADIVDKATRSRMMSGIRGSNTRPELRVRSFLHRRGLRFRLHSRDLPGRPDIVLRKWNAVVFVHGCFWHRHQGCRFATFPKTDALRWSEKFDANVARDERVQAQLQAAGWNVIVVWGCETDDAALEKVVRRIRTGEST